MQTSSTYTFFRTLRRGKHRLALWPGVEADGSIESTTPSKLEIRDEMGRLEKASLATQVEYRVIMLCIVASEEVRAWRPPEIRLVG